MQLLTSSGSRGRFRSAGASGCTEPLASSVFCLVVSWSLVWRGGIWSWARCRSAGDEYSGWSADAAAEEGLGGGDSKEPSLEEGFLLDPDISRDGRVAMFFFFFFYFV
jgi:hypothetical protein